MCWNGKAWLSTGQFRVVAGHETTLIGHIRWAVQCITARMSGGDLPPVAVRYHFKERRHR